ncbi:MAG: tRNA (adenosine(37)-N6)-threonylcarbamoyltransferase complex ATPase subunit type 1 TsaE [Verrucomicrobiota bacterium]
MSTLDKFSKGIVASDANESIQAGCELAATLPSESIVTLTGDLGAGKTTFIKGFAKAWSIRELITSPTFNIYNLYRGDRTLIHLDAYRLEGSSEVFDELMIEDFMNPPYCLAIEWPSKLGELPWPVTCALDFQIQPNHSRLITLRPTNQ